MEIKVTQNIDDNYYQEFYSEWLSHRSVYRKWQDKLGWISILTAIFLFVINSNLKFYAIALILFGGLLIYDYYASKYFWMKRRKDSKMNYKAITIIFEDHQIQSSSPFAEMKGKWEMFDEAIETKKGIFLIPETGISIYLQKHNFQNPSDIKLISTKINDN